MDRVLAGLPRVEEERKHEELPVVAIVGRPNVGKSTLVNALLGEERVVVFDEPGTTRDSIRVTLERGDRRYVLIDTAGVRRRARVTDVVEKYSVIKALQAVEAANVVILLLDAHAGIGEQDAMLAGFIVERGRAVVLAVNKWDGLDAAQRTRIKDELHRKMPFLQFARVHYISARHATGIAELFSSVDRAFASAHATLPTPRLNRVLQGAVQASAPPRARGGPVRLKYAHQAGKNPPRVVIHGTRVDAVSPSYRRYLSKAVRLGFGLEGTPVQIELRPAHNPFAQPARQRSRRLKTKGKAVKRRGAR
jgi:GTP-binding protein